MRDVVTPTDPEFDALDDAVQDAIRRLCPEVDPGAEWTRMHATIHAELAREHDLSQGELTGHVRQATQAARERLGLRPRRLGCSAT